MIRKAIAACGLVMAQLAPAPAQDIKGLEICTAEKNMQRRTSCLQSNVEFLQQALTRETRRAQERETAAERELGALKSALSAAQAEIAGLKKAAKPDSKTEKK